MSTTTFGLTGMSNLGNTCYMNAAIQCLAHNPGLSHYFLSNKYLQDLNTENKITQGKVATSMAGLMALLWRGEKSIKPADYKLTVGKIDSRWRGFEQQDSQEHVVFTLSCLHDDLNRVKGGVRHAGVNEKLPEKELAEAVLADEKRVNDSVIDDFFKGLLRSQVTCPDCTTKVTKFDPAYDLHLPLPSHDLKSFRLLVIPASGDQLFFDISLKRETTVSQLLQHIVDNCSIAKPDGLYMAEVHQERFIKFFNNPNEPIASIHEDDQIFVFELTYPTKGPSMLRSLDCVYLQVLQRARITVPSQDKSSYEQQYELVCYPILLVVPKVVEAHQLRTLIHEKIRSVITVKDGADPQLVNNFEIFICSDTEGTTMGERLLSQPIKFRTGLNAVAVEWSKQGLRDGIYQTKKSSFISVCPDGSNKKALKLTDCLDEFVRAEKLSKDDLWNCPTCKEAKQATKKMDVWQHPPILTFGIKRFVARRVGLKNEKPVQYPLQGLDIAPYISNPDSKDSSIYDLFGVICHKGMLATVGHYTAYARNPMDDQWYYFDDASVSKVSSLSDVVTPSAYVLFYQRRDIPNPLKDFEFPFTGATSS